MSKEEVFTPEMLAGAERELDEIAGMLAEAPKLPCQECEAIENQPLREEASEWFEEKVFHLVYGGSAEIIIGHDTREADRELDKAMSGLYKTWQRMDFRHVYLSDLSDYEQRTLVFLGREHDVRHTPDITTEEQLGKVATSVEVLAGLPENVRNLYWLLYHSVDFFNCEHELGDVWSEFTRKRHKWHAKNDKPLVKPQSRV